MFLCVCVCTFCGALITPMLYPNCRDPRTAVKTERTKVPVTAWKHSGGIFRTEHHKGALWLYKTVTPWPLRTSPTALQLQYKLSLWALKPVAMVTTVPVKRFHFLACSWQLCWPSYGERSWWFSVTRAFQPVAPSQTCSGCLDCWYFEDKGLDTIIVWR